jgi:hypothetical protein
LFLSTNLNAIAVRIKDDAFVVSIARTPRSIHYRDAIVSQTLRELIDKAI